MNKAAKQKQKGRGSSALGRRFGQGPFGAHVRQLRKKTGLTLSGLSQKSGLSVSAISKIEREQISPTFFNLMRLAEGLNIHVADLVTFENTHDTPTARMAVTRKAEQKFTEADQYSIASLCGSLEKKRMKPLINRVSPENPNHPVENIAHHGEEFVHVLRGRVEIRTDAYQTVILEAGDSIYFDSSMLHSYVSADANEAEVCVIWLPTASQNDAAVAAEMENIVRLRQPEMKRLRRSPGNDT